MTISYSGYTMYLTCPSSFKRKYILKEEGGEEPTRETAPAMFRGTDIHNSIEDYMHGIGKLHREISPRFRFYVQRLVEGGAEPELSFAFMEDWEPTTFDNPDAEIRGFMDSVLCTEHELTIDEWKTGKEYDEHSKQRALYGMCALILFPMHDKVTVNGVYLDQDNIVTNTYTRAELETYKWMWTRRINKTKPPQPYPMRPSWKCRYCQFSKYKGGKCPN